MGIDGFMFHDMLYWRTAPLSHPGSSLVYTANFNPIYPKLTTLYNSPFYTSSLSLIDSSFSVSVCMLLFTSPPLSPSMSPSFTFSLA